MSTLRSSQACSEPLPFASDRPAILLLIATLPLLLPIAACEDASEQSTREGATSHERDAGELERDVEGDRDLTFDASTRALDAQLTDARSMASRDTASSRSADASPFADGALADGALADGGGALGRMPEGGAGVCGNGIPELGESCDDGNDDRFDGCLPDCSAWRIPDHPPITPQQPRTWEAVNVAGASCRDGSPAHFRINTNPGSDKLVIFLEQGGACVPGACFAINDDSVSDEGMFDRSDARNPFRDWNYVYVPYCTGDLHAGDRQDVEVDGERMQFVGYRNFGLFLERLVPTFRTVTQVALTGASAGAFGATLNFPRTQDAFGPIEVVLIADSGPLMSSKVLRPCQQRAWREAWNLEGTVLAHCGADCPDHDDWSSAWLQHIQHRYPARRAGFFSTTEDLFISTLYGLGLNDCDPPLIPLVEGANYTAGLRELRRLVSLESSNFGTYFDVGIAHICFDTTCLYDTRVEGVALSDWVRDLLTGTVRHVGP